MKKLSILTFLALGCIAHPGQAQIQQTVASGPADWNTALWGSPAAAPTSANTYITTAGLEASSTIGGNATGVPASSDTLRAIDVTPTNTFAGSSLTLATSTRLLLKMVNGNTISANLILQNNSNIDYAPNSYNSGTLAGILSLASGVTSYIGGGNLNDVPTFNINSTLTGSGTLDVFNFANNPKIVFGGNLSGFGGNLNFINGAAFSITTTNLLGTTLTFSNTAETAAGSSFAINNAINVAGLMLGSTSLGVGSYTAAQLDAVIGGGSSFFAGGSNITVVPEPSTWIATLGAIGALAGVQALRRRRA